ncbi:hypothetical protein JL721_397 [Aureococcus anophagefferens]|nr:hypothetical protein JL721_397 [Aureococcus anophagefferens]
MLFVRGVFAFTAPARRTRLLARCFAAARSYDYDVVVIGGGHAGCEAAAAAARGGARTALVTQRVDTVGEMSCNPSIGGIGKGHLVREVDALGGVMGRAIDAAGIHFRMLNRRKGPAVWGPRAQADRDLYRAFMRGEIASGAYENLDVLEASAEDESRPAGRFVRDDGTGGSGDLSGDVEPPSTGLAKTLELDLGLPLGRLKTGTPPRLDGRTIDWSKCVAQPSEDPPFAFSYGNAEASPRGTVACARTATNERTHDIVRAEAHTLAPPSVSGTGPRYCPSLYKKVERFGDRSSHVVWLEPEGLNTDLVYPNGLSGAFPLDVQERIVRSIAGLENAVIVQPGYDVEYDFVDPRSLDHGLGVKKARGLFLAGQICGTTGYEEAAALGLVAGANAALAAGDGDAAASARRRFVVGRDEGYIGVLVDDLVTRGTMEPYRMFTSRAEYRLALRADNADLRLTRLGAARVPGLVEPDRLAACEARARHVADAKARCDALRFAPEAWAPAFLSAEETNRDDHSKRSHKSASQLLAMPHATLEGVLELAAAQGEELPIAADARDTVAALCKYAAYLDRMDRDVAAYKRNDATKIPPDLDYSAANLPALSAEEREKLRAAPQRSRRRPGSRRHARVVSPYNRSQRQQAAERCRGASRAS